jgi:hypothetical protein
MDTKVFSQWAQWLLREKDLRGMLLRGTKERAFGSQGKPEAWYHPHSPEASECAQV